MQSVSKVKTASLGDEAMVETYITKLSDPTSVPYLSIKRFLDILFSIMLGILVVPVVSIAAVLIKLESKGPVLFHQERVGLMGKHIVITKLRSMKVDAEINGAQWASKDDPRVTRIGRVLRKTRIDELPQLLSVIRGDLSLIGPRPERPIFTEKFSRECPGFEQRLLIKPGLSGYAQVHGGYDISPQEKAKLDIYYAHNVSFKMDVKIFFETIMIVITGKGAR